MRAAVKYVARVSKTPYGDLSRFWNERLGTPKYGAEQIKDRLRKGHPLRRTEGAVTGALARWRRLHMVICMVICATFSRGPFRSTRN